MYRDILIGRVKQVETFFNRSTSAFTEEDSSFVPVGDMFSVAAQVVHAGQTVEWLIEGAFGNGWAMDFDKHVAEARACTSLSEARQVFAKAIQHAVDVIGSKSDEELQAAFPADDPVLPGAPKGEIVGAMEDHSAHHRGALTVYARLLGKQSPMPYM